MLVLPPIILCLLFISFLIFGSWFDMPVCWATLAACSGYESAALFLLLYAASSLITDPLVDLLWRRTDGKQRRSTQRLGLTIILAVLMAAGAYAYLTLGGEGAAAILSLVTSDGIVVLGFALIAMAFAAGLFFGVVGILGEVSVIFVRYLRNLLQRENV
jgi:hypothetical protein